MKFEILMDYHFNEIYDGSELMLMDRKKILSLINGYEGGKWRYQTFQNFIWDNIKDTALSYRERQALTKVGEGSMISHAVKNLRLVESTNAIGRGSEIAEIILYGIMKAHYKALPVVPKIFYKENTNDEAKGSDSVHIVVEDDDNFTLWFGESKFYNSIENSRLDVIVKSVKESISLSKIKKENSLITNVGDLDDFEEINDTVRNKIKRFLSQDESIDNIKPLLHIPILLLHECAITKQGSALTEEYRASIIEHHKERAIKYFEKQMSECSSTHFYEKITFHIILFPVADKEKIVNKFIQIAKANKDD